MTNDSTPSPDVPQSHHAETTGRNSASPRRGAVGEAADRGQRWRGDAAGAGSRRGRDES